MKSFQECKDEVSQERIAENWDVARKVLSENVKDAINEVAAKRFATQFKIKLSPDRVLTQAEFNKQYEHYQELLNLEDVAGFYADQFAMANAERNDLKQVVKEPTEEEIKIAGYEYFGKRKDIVFDAWIEGIKWYKSQKKG